MRCRKARWFLSARCDGTLSERQRVRLDDHLHHCAECRREAFYFSEVGSLLGRVEQLPVRPDFNVRLRAAIQCHEAEAAAPRRWYQWDITPAWRVATGLAMVMVLFAVSYGGYHVLSASPEAPVTVVPAPETAVHASTFEFERELDVSRVSHEPWNGYQGGWSEVDPLTPDGIATQERYLSTQRGPGEYVLETFRINDPTAADPEPNYLMPMIRSDQMVQRVSY